MEFIFKDFAHFIGTLILMWWATECIEAIIKQIKN